MVHRWDLFPSAGWLALILFSLYALRIWKRAFCYVARGKNANHIFSGKALVKIMAIARCTLPGLPSFEHDSNSHYY